MSRPSDGRVLEATQEQFDVYLDMAAVLDMDAHKGSFYDESRKLILKGNGFAFELFFGKRIRDTIPFFVGLVRPLPYVRNFLLDSVTSLIVSPDGKESALDCQIFRHPTDCKIVADLDRFEVKSFHFIFKFKADDGGASGGDDDEATLASGLLKELDTPSFSDAIVVCGDQEFKVHRVLLSARSDVFKAMFGHDATLESQTGRVEIIDFSPKTISSLLKFVYADEVPYDEINLDLLSASHKYMIRPLFNSCQQYLSVRLKLGNAVQLFTASIKYDAEILKKAANSFIMENFDKIKETPEWGKFVRESPAATAVAQILESALTRLKKAEDKKNE